MSQIARCPACTTMFRVLAEQLEMAQGWVRCGQCGEVFDAGLHLLPDPAGLTGQGPAQEAVAPLNSPTTPAISYGLAKVSARERQGTELGPDNTVLTELTAQPLEKSTVPVQEPEAIPEVDFVRESRHREFWRSPLVRSGLSLICLALIATLLLQLAIQQKDVLAAQDPRLAPLLQAVCRLAGCEVRPMRRIGSIIIEQASFNKTGVDAYRLTFVFRNTGDAVVELPAREVTLTDSSDQAVMRRVIMPTQFATGAATLAGYADLAGALSFKVADVGNQAALLPVQASLLPVASYRILAFYP